jgi:hypothetical protein
MQQDNAERAGTGEEGQRSARRLEHTIRVGSVEIAIWKNQGATGRRASNPRRPAWEVNRRLSIKDLCVQGVDTRQPNSLIPRGRSSNPPLME